MGTTSRPLRPGWPTLAAAAIVMILSSACVGSAPSASAEPPASSSASPTSSVAAAPTAKPAPTPDPTTAPTPDATPASPSAVKVPAAPTSAKIRVSDGALGAYDVPEQEFEVSWSETYPADTEIRVYGVTECINNVDSEPCLVLHTPLPDSVRDLVAKAPAGDGSTGWTWPGWENIGGAMAMNPDGEHYYYAFVAAAYNAAGHSKFIILDSSTACPDCTY
jgi:hypothetical protein